MSAWTRIRRNHALEHATVAAMVQRRGRRVPVIGLSTPAGFLLAGSFSPEEAKEATADALRRLQAGEAYLAVSDDCGTSLLVSGAITAVTVAAITRRGLFSRLPMAITAAIAISRFTPQLGRRLQRALTTDARLEESEIHGIWTARLARDVSLAHVRVRDSYRA